MTTRFPGVAITCPPSLKTARAARAGYQNRTGACRGCQDRLISPQGKEHRATQSPISLNNQSGVEKKHCLSPWPSAGGTETVRHSNKLRPGPRDRICAETDSVAHEPAQTVLRLAVAKKPTVQRLARAVNSKSQRGELRKMPKHRAHISATSTPKVASSRISGARGVSCVPSRDFSE